MSSYVSLRPYRGRNSASIRMAQSMRTPVSTSAPVARSSFGERKPVEIAYEG
jgi:hypothetical protein